MYTFYMCIEIIQNTLCRIGAIYARLIARNKILWCQCHPEAGLCVFVRVCMNVWGCGGVCVSVQYVWYDTCQ
jgi:hypothetical protein